MDKKIVTTKTGRKMYYVDGKLTTKDKYKAVEEPNSSTIMADPFCGASGPRVKFVNLINVRLCEDHYQNKTTGEIAAELKKAKP